MAYVSWPRTLIARATVAGRGIAGLPDWQTPAAVTLGLLAMVETLLRGGELSAGVSAAVLIGLVGTVPLALAGTHSGVAAATITTATLALLATGFRPTVAAMIAQVVALYLIGRRRHRRVPLLTVVLFAAFPLAAALGGEIHDWILGIVLLALSAGALAIGGAQQAREEARRRGAAERAIADSLLEHAARGERVRIARELHDVVAHHISMIAVQVETARLTTNGLSPEGARRLVAIGDTARTALAEMRRLLGLLREDAATEVARRPQPGLEQLNGLIDEARELARASTRLIVSGTVVPLDPGVELTAYRIVQEALTNARRHAPGASVDVELTYASCELHVRVRDNGPGPPDDRPPDGHGLLGMRERAAMVGGDVRAGRAVPGGFLVEAVFPTDRAAP